MKKIFVSSTFRDMHFERDTINNIIMPKLSKIAQEYGEDVYFVDLRWGIDTADLSDVNYIDNDPNKNQIEKELKSNLKVLNSCMAAIDECDYFLVFLGDRYGSKFDLSKLYNSALLDDDTCLSYSSDVSVTEFEIDYGPLNSRHKELLKKTIFMFRDPVIGAPDYFFENGDDEDEKKSNKIKIEKLKDKISQYVLEFGGSIINYSLEWDTEKNYIKPNEDFLTSIVSTFLSMFSNEKDKWDNLSFKEKERILVNTHIANNANKLIGRKLLVEKIYNDINKRQVIHVLGDSHSGKTVLISSVIKKCIENNIYVAPFFYDLSYSSMCEVDYYRQWSDYIVELLGEDIKKSFLYFNVKSYEEQVDPKYEYHTNLNFEKSSKNLDCYYYYKDRFFKYLDAFEIKNIGKLLLVIDSNNSVNIDLEFYFKKYKNISILVGSWYNGSRIKNRKSKCYYLDDFPLSPGDVMNSRLLQLNKHLNEEVKNEIIKKNIDNNQFYLSLAVQRLMIMDEKDFNIKTSIDDDVIKFAQLEIIKNFPATLEEMFLNIIEEIADRFGREQIINIITLLSVSSLRLNKIDIKNILSPLTLKWEDNVLDHFIYSLPLLISIDVNGNIGFSEPIIKDIIKERYSNDKVLESALEYFEKRLNLNKDNWKDIISYRLYNNVKLLNVDYEEAMSNLDEAFNVWLNSLRNLDVYTSDEYLNYGRQIFNSYTLIWNLKKEYELERVINIFNSFKMLKETLTSKIYLTDYDSFSINKIYFIFYEIIFGIITYRVFTKDGLFDENDALIVKKYYLDYFDKEYLQCKRYKIKKGSKFDFYLLTDYYNRIYNKKNYRLNKFKKNLIFDVIFILILILLIIINYLINYR